MAVISVTLYQAFSMKHILFFLRSLGIEGILVVVSFPTRFIVLEQEYLINLPVDISYLDIG